jgi:hypothetical protein
LARTVVEHRVLIISPGDVPGARQAVRDAIADWNAHVGVAKGVRLEPVGWETHAHPGSGAAPQEIINDQLVDSCDLGVAVFGGRLGSPTKAAESGSAEEVKRLVDAGRPVLIYRNTGTVAIDRVDAVQLEALREFLDQIKDKALLGDFSDESDLRRKVALHLTRVVDEDLAAESLPAPKVEPDQGIRVVVSTGLPMPPPEDPHLQVTISVTIENHSGRKFYFSNLQFQLDSGEVAQPLSDVLTRRPIASTVIDSGDSITYNFSALGLIEQLTETRREALQVVVADKIGRKFLSGQESLRTVLENAKKLLATGRERDG